MDSHKVSDVTKLTAEVGGDLDHASAEALRLEILRLANKYGFDVEYSRISSVTAGAGDRARHANPRTAKSKKKALRPRRA